MTVHERSVRAPGPIGLIRARAELERSGQVERTQISEQVATSWQRCLDARLDPLDEPENLVADHAAFGQILGRHDMLRKLAQPELELLFGQVSGSNYLLALGSPEGVIMDVLADTSFRDTEAGRTIVEGSIWDEDVRGTNAMGLVLHDRAARSVWRGEHFFRSQIGVSCISVPIFGSDGGVSGVLDASTGSEDWHPHSAALLNLSAANIEAGLFHFEQATRTILRVHPRAEYLSTMSAGLIAIDDDGRIVATSRRAQEILGLSGLSVTRRLDDLFREPEGEILTRLPSARTFACTLRTNGTVFVSSSHCRLRRQHRAGLPAPPAGRPAARDAAAPAERAQEPVYADPTLRRQLKALERIVAARVPIMITGESGTGKTTLARHIHRLGGLCGDFVALRCAGVGDEGTISALLAAVEDMVSSVSEGDARREGRRGTLFLDGVDELPETAKGALLRILDACEDGDGGAGPGPQIISSTRDAAGPACGTRAIRPDLYYRLSAFSISLPRLRLRRDIGRIAAALMAELAPGRTLDPESSAMLASHDWHGNIRELRSILTVAAAIAEGAVIARLDVAAALRGGQPDLGRPIDRYGQRPSPCLSCLGSLLRRERCMHIRETYISENGNACRTARKLGIARSTVYEHIRGLAS